MSSPVYIPLRCHSEYSLSEGIVRVKELPAKARALGYPAVGLTDDGAMFGALKFDKAAMAAGVKPLHGVDIYLRRGKAETGRATLLCLSNGGVRSLAKILTRMQLSRQPDSPAVLDLNEVTAADTEGVVLLAGHLDGLLGVLAGRGMDGLLQLMDALKAAFPERVYLEVSRRGVPGEEELNDAVLELAARRNLPVVVADPVYFLTPDDFEVQEMRAAIAQGCAVEDPKRRRLVRAGDYLPSPAEMAERYRDLPEALENTVQLAIRASSGIEIHPPELPHFGEAEDEAAALSRNARSGLDALAAAGKLKSGSREEYDERLALELGVIVNMKFPGYFLIVADFIRWARANGVPVGPGRGSGAGSLVAYALGITQIDPLAYGLLFERFLNPERVSLPDLDIDFCVDGRDRVVNYVQERYGKENVGQIITFSRMAAKSVVRDVGRVLGFPYPVVDRLARLIPDEVGMTLAKAIADSEDLRNLLSTDDDSRQIYTFAQKLEGLPRQPGTHAGGVIIAPRPLTEYCPLYSDGHAIPVTQFDMNDAESAGLVKFDFLGLKAITTLYQTMEAVNSRRVLAGEPRLDLESLPLADAEVYADLSAGGTAAVFQLEGDKMTELIKRFKPASFEDLTALVALFRPGPLNSGMVDDYIKRKDGLEPVAYTLPALEPILKPTYGVIVYQEQVQQIARVLAGYSLGKADVLRRAMGKKKPEEMARERAIFMAGAVKQKVDADKAGYIFDLMEKFAGYGFNKSHSAAYALVGWWCAWLKHHYPAEFMAASMSHVFADADKMADYVAELRRLGVTVLSPDVNQSAAECTATDGLVRVGLGAVGGVGSSVMVPLIAARAGTPYTSLMDLAVRVPAVLEGSALEAFIKAGACDVFGPRGGLLSIAGTVRRAARQYLQDKERNQSDLFGGDGTTLPSFPCPDVELSQVERCLAEKESLGFFLTGHPVQAFAEEIARLSFCRLADAEESFKRTNGYARGGGGYPILVGGYVTRVSKFPTGNGRPMANVVIHDGTGSMTMVVFPDAYATEGGKLEEGQVLFFQGQGIEDSKGGPLRFAAQRVLTLNQARVERGKGLTLRLKAGLRTDEGGKKAIWGLLKQSAGGNWPVTVSYQDRPDEPIALGAAMAVKPSAQLLDALSPLSQVSVTY